MYEVPGQRFADLSDNGFGVSLIADTKYGYSGRHHVLGVSLLRGPTYPDPVCDQGVHRFTLALYPHDGPWHDAETLELAEHLTKPLVQVDADMAEQLTGLLSVSDNIILSAVKLAEDRDAVLVRFYEPRGRAGVATVSLGSQVVCVERSNGLEDAGEPIAMTGEGSVRIAVRGFEVVTLLFVLSERGPHS
jgi:alpha-mannosidase